MKDFQRATTPIEGFQSQRNWTDRIQIDVYPDDVLPNTVNISDFATLGETDKGDGSKGLSFIMNLANKHQVTLVGVVSSARTDFSNEELKQWYLDRGFESDGVFLSEDDDVPDLPKIIYKPKL